jgi:hypothetical protein
MTDNTPRRAWKTTSRDPQGKLQIEAMIAIVNADIWRRERFATIARLTAVYGDGDGHDIAGIGRAHFPDSDKDGLRFMRDRENELTDSAYQLWRESGRLRGMLTRFAREWRER